MYHIIISVGALTPKLNPSVLPAMMDFKTSTSTAETGRHFKLQFFFSLFSFLIICSRSMYIPLMFGIAGGRP